MPHTLKDDQLLALVRALIARTGDDPDREGLSETPRRFLQAWDFWTSGYHDAPHNVVKLFNHADYDEMVFQGNIPIFSLCVAESTFVETPRGRIPIKYLKHNDWVYTVDPISYEINLAQCKNPRMTQRKAALVRVYTDNDTLLCTPDHECLTFNRAWVKASNLKPGDSLVSLYRGMQHLKNPYKMEPTSRLIARRYNKKDGPSILFMGKDEHVLEHRFVWYCLTGDWLEKKPIHHKNNTRWDNDPSNLECLSIGDHNRVHNRLRLHNTKGTPEYKKRLNLVIKSTQNPEVRRKRSISVAKHWERLRSNPKAYQQRCEQMSDGIYAKRNHIVLGVEVVPWREDVWCMNIPHTQTFFANGIAVHNCEHHLAPFFGVVHIAYIPTDHIIGLSKLSRLADVFTRRLQVQERLTNQIADAIKDILKPRGCGVVTQCRHMRMESRGIQKHGTLTTVSAVRGALMDKPEARAEFMSLVNTTMQNPNVI